jgi:glycosyltransferase involved in cell wall biosynthesis
MRIGVNALYLIPGGVGGTETYLRALLPALGAIDCANDYFIFTNQETGAGLVPPMAHFHHQPQAVRAVNRVARLLWEQTRLPAEARRLKLDVLLNPGFTSPIVCPCPQVTVFHDLQHKRHPEYFRWFDLPAWNFFLYWSARVARTVLADSEATAVDLARFYHLGPPKVRTVPLGVAPDFFALAARRNPEKFVLGVSTLHPHKNLDGLMRAFAIFRRNHPEYRLIVCGMHGFFTGQLHTLREQLGLAESVEFPGWIPKADLYDLYAHAMAFIYPSKFEGFGLPVLEALAAAVPSACSRIEPLDSMAASAALKFDPGNPAEMAACMERLVMDSALRETLAKAGPARAAEFTWPLTAQRTLAALMDAVVAPKG